MQSFKSKKKGVKLVALLVCLVIVLAGCGTVAQTTSQTPSTGDTNNQPLTKISIRLGTTNVEGFEVPMILALEKGYYKEVGLDLQVNMGNGYATNVQLTGNDSTTFAMADVASVANGVSHGIPVKMVALVATKGANGIIFSTDKPITKPSDMIGKSIAVSQGSGSTFQFETWLAVNKIDKSQIKEVSVSGSAKVTAFSMHKVDTLVGGLDDDMIDATKENPGKAGFISLSDTGLNLPGAGIVASNNYITKHPDVITKFIAATRKGWDYAKLHPDEANSITEKKYPDVDKTYIEQSFKANLEILAVPIPNKPWGYIDGDMWQTALDIFKNSQGIQPTGNLGDYFTNTYLGQ